ncbi:hypothetical protein [Sinorhizobium sp. CCBAU 05631]|uniref:DUF6950 family protein n=1 Tax=Sinorhizobium sp. CCBAU 05631 TaxID=794846 RepID=UPI0004B06279|nr:hypothetical protein [Sinorhizobium sp. CCBAU 05631]ASY56497.1 Phage protein [Sinorhizobium sp. CCBAU 05631]
MERTLAEFIGAYREKSWRPGEVDCCLFLAAWAIWLGHSDPAQHLRGTYDSEDGFRAIIERAGSVSALVGSCVAVIGGKNVQRPACGAFGVIGSAGNIYRQFGAIHDGKRWNVRFKNGVGFMAAAPLAIWVI